MISPNGFDNLLWFMGIVEDNIDPTNAGRVRVRCFGIHPPYDSGEVATDELPWAIPINGTYGDTAVIPKKAEWVFGFFIDGRDAQHPMILGVIPGQNLQLPTDSGSSDPYIKPSAEAIDAYGRPPLHPMKTLEDLETLPQVIIQDSARLDGISTPTTPGSESPGDGWDEPATPVGGDAHKTTIITSNYGNSFLQISGDEDNEAFVISHSSGSHIQIDPSGNIKLKSLGDMYNLSEGHTREYTEGRRDVTINGKYTINAKGDCILEVQGDLSHIVHGDYNLNVARRMNFSIGQGFEIAAQRVTLEAVSEHINLISAEKIKMSAGDIVSIQSGTDMYLTSGATINVKAVGDTFVGTDASLHMTAGSNIHGSAAGSYNATGGSLFAADAGNIHLNSGQSTAATAATATTETPASPQIEAPTSEGVTSDAGPTGLGSVGGGFSSDSVDDFE